MTLLELFVADTGATETDEYLVQKYIAPALDRVSELTLNSKKITVQVQSGVQSYDLKDSDVASPVVLAQGVETIIVDQYSNYTYLYKTDYYFETPTSLYFPNSETPQTGEIEILVNQYYIYPIVATEEPLYTETDLKANLWAAVVDYAAGNYQIDRLTNAVTESSEYSGVEEKSEENLKIRYGSTKSRMENLLGIIKRAEDRMKAAPNAKSNFYSFQSI